jgi:hypothetical protein
MCIPLVIGSGLLDVSNHYNAHKPRKPRLHFVRHLHQHLDETESLTQNDDAEGPWGSFSNLQRLWQL